MRIRETEETQKKLQSHLNKTLAEIRDQERHIEQLRAAVKAKGQPLKTAQARLALRSKLPTEEACLDLAHVLLLEEVRPELVRGDAAVLLRAANDLLVFIITENA